MTRKIAHLLPFAMACLFGLPLRAQDKAAHDRLMAAHAQYYTPTESGLKSFQCGAAIDWKAMLTRFSGKEITDDNPVVKYLQTVHLSVTDELTGKGSLQWTSTGTPPEGTEAALKQIQQGLETTVAGFFQSWNAYMNGSMVPLPDSTVTVKTVADGVHLSGVSKDMSLDEDFDKNMLLTQALVVSPDSKVLAIPIYANTADGRLVSSIKSQVNQPPTAPQTEIAISVEYGKVDSFQIPSHVVFDIKNTGIIEIGFNACQVSLADWAKKP